MTKPSILYLAPMASIHARRWIGHFIDQGHRVAIIDGGESELDIESFKGVEIQRIRWDGNRGPVIGVLQMLSELRRATREMAAIISAFAPDVIHVHQLKGMRALALTQTGHGPIIGTPWGTDVLILPDDNWRARKVLGRLLQRIDAYCADAPHLLDRLRELGARSDDMRLIYFGTDTERFSPAAADSGLAVELGFAADTPLVLSNRSLSPVYDVATLVRAAPRILAARPDARIVIVGGGSELEALQQLARELGVEQQVCFAGRLSDADMVRYSASATVYISTSLSDGGLAASTAEAMACGVPVVISDFGENAGWLDDGAAGTTFPLKDDEALAERVLEFLAEPVKCRAAGAAGREIICERNSVAGEMAKVNQLYLETMATWRNKQP